MNAHLWDAEGRSPIEYVGIVGRWGFMAFGLLFAVSCAAQVDPASIAGHLIGDEAPWLVKLCGGMMSICLGIIWWQQKQLNKLHGQLRADFREMIRVAQRFLDNMDKAGSQRGNIAFVDEDVAQLIAMRTKHDKGGGQ